MDIDTTIRELFNKLNTRKALVDELKKHTAKSWKTNGTLRLLGASTPTNIQTASVELVDEVALNLCVVDSARNTAQARLGTQRQIAPKIQGYTIDDWFSDLTKRLATINIREEEKQLEMLEQRLNQVLSPEERRRIEVELLAKEIGL